MKPNPESEIIQAEQVDGGVAITFGNDRSYLFLAKFLHAHIGDAEDITDILELAIPKI